jgi:small-conductance mechanosensitive channel
VEQDWTRYAISAAVVAGVWEHETFLRYRTFSDSSVDFNVILRARTMIDRFLVQHEFVKRLHRRFEQEAIEIPFPQSVLPTAGHAAKPA